jgi:hypothetical protein
MEFVDPSNEVSIRTQSNAIRDLQLDVNYLKEKDPDAKDWKVPRLKVKVTTIGGQRFCGNYVPGRTMQTARKSYRARDGDNLGHRVIRSFGKGLKENGGDRARETREENRSL